MYVDKNSNNFVKIRKMVCNKRKSSPIKIKLSHMHTHKYPKKNFGGWKGDECPPIHG